MGLYIRNLSYSCKTMRIIQAQNKRNGVIYTWSYVIPKNIIELIHREGLVLLSDRQERVIIKKDKHKK